MKREIGFVAVMTSVAERQETRESSLRSCIEAGIDHVNVFIQEAGVPLSHASARLNGLRALAWAEQERPNTPALYLEDDIEVAANALDMIWLALGMDELVMLYSPFDADWPYRPEDVRQRLRGGQRLQRLLYPLPRFWFDWDAPEPRLWGAQALIVPPWLIHATVNEWPHALPGNGIDWQLLLAVQASDRPVYLAAPDAFQHRPVPSACGGHADEHAPVTWSHASPTYGR